MYHSITCILKFTQSQYVLRNTDVSWNLCLEFGIKLIFFLCVSQVMLAASYWSLLAPAIGMAEDSGKYGSLAFLPVAVGFSLGAAFVYFADLAMPLLVRNSYL